MSEEITLIELNQILDKLSRRDVYDVVTNHSLPFPNETISLALIETELFSKTLVKSGRNPEYGYMITQRGRIFATWVQREALREFLAKRK